MAALMLALSAPVALGADTMKPADTGTEDTGGEDTEDTQDTEDTEDTTSGDTGTGDVPNSQEPDILDNDSLNTGSSGNPSALTEADGCGGSMAVLALPLLLGWRVRRS